jgi:hypothetical protein
MNAIKQNADKLILAVGLGSQNDFPSFPAKELSKILNKPIFDVPGGHLGYVVEPQEFASKLLAELQN